MGKLSDRAIKALGDGTHGDGEGLYIQVKGPRRSWLYRYKIKGKSHALGLGAYPLVGLKDARDKAQAMAKARANGQDPLIERRLAATRERTFDQVGAEYIDQHKAAWRSEKTRYIWELSLKTHAGPIFGALPVASVTRGHVLDALSPVWSKKPETARRLRRQIEAVLSFATAKGYRTGDNPALWRGGLQYALPKLSRVQKVRNHPALPFKETPAFMRRLEACPASSALALRFLILTAGRTSEVLGATWQEVDLETRVWTIPGARMKAEKEHRVPLSDAAVEILKLAKMQMRDGNSHIWPGDRRGRPLSNMCFLQLLKRLDRTDITPHGFRSTFRDWAAETTHFQNHVVEMALAHTIGNAVEAAYRRGDLLDKRRELMKEWAAFCCSL